MAPRKEKPEKVSANEAADTILNYLRKQNRPYSATDISANLHNTVTKAAAAKVLKELQDRKEIEGRAAGKQIVYHAIQNPDDSMTPEQLAALDTNITTLREQTTAAVATAKSLRSTLSSLNSTLSTSNLVSSVQALEAEKDDIEKRLEALKAGKAKKVTKKEREQTESEWRKWSVAMKRREKIVVEMWKMIEDALPDQSAEKKAEVRESLGLDE